jgi:hypothetical protein
MPRALRQLHAGQQLAEGFGRYGHRCADRRRTGDCRDGAFSYRGFKLGATTGRQWLRDNPIAHAPTISASPIEERVGPVGLPQFRERLLLDLPDALTSEADVAADLVERVRPTLGKPEPQR